LRTGPRRGRMESGAADNVREEEGCESTFSTRVGVRRGARRRRRRCRSLDGHRRGRREDQRLLPRRGRSTGAGSARQRSGRLQVERGRDLVEPGRPAGAGGAGWACWPARTAWAGWTRGVGWACWAGRASRAARAGGSPRAGWAGWVARPARPARPTRPTGTVGTCGVRGGRRDRDEWHQYFRHGDRLLPSREARDRWCLPDPWSRRRPRGPRAPRAQQPKVERRDVDRASGGAQRLQPHTDVHGHGDGSLRERLSLREGARHTRAEPLVWGCLSSSLSEPPCSPRRRRPTRRRRPSETPAAGTSDRLPNLSS